MMQRTHFTVVWLSVAILTCTRVTLPLPPPKKNHATIILNESVVTRTQVLMVHNVFAKPSAIVSWDGLMES